MARAVEGRGGREPVDVEVYCVAGLSLASALRLAAPTVREPPDWTVHLGGPRLSPPGSPGDEVIAELSGRDQVLYRVVSRPGGDLVALVLPGLADFEVDLLHRVVVAHAHPQGDPGLLPVLVAGTLVALLLSLSGEVVLHASAVEVAGEAIAFVGGSGQGKTTVAALCCAAGYPLVADDLLVVRPEEDGSVSCLPGSRELRLRSGAAPIADLLAVDGSMRRPTVDARTAVSPQASALGRLPLRAVALPWPQHRSGRVELSTLGPARATVTLLRAQRIVNWRPRERAGMWIEKMSCIAAAVPVSSLAVPWGPPWDPALGRLLVSALAGGA